MQNLKRNGALLLQGALVVTFWVLAALRQDDNDWTPAVPILILFAWAIYQRSR